MGRQALTKKLEALKQALLKAMSYRSKPGCPGCLTPVMDEQGKPVIVHCSQKPKD